MPEGVVSSALLEHTRVDEERERGQSPLFDDLRRERPGPDPGGPWSDPEDPEPAIARGERTPRSGGGRLTLESQLERTWEGLVAAGAADCPICAGAMERAGSGGRCSSCGSSLH
jgi:hypothetical protein